MKLEFEARGLSDGSRAARGEGMMGGQVDIRFNFPRTGLRKEGNCFSRSRVRAVAEHFGAAVKSVRLLRIANLSRLENQRRTRECL